MVLLLPSLWIFRIWAQERETQACLINCLVSFNSHPLPAGFIWWPLLLLLSEDSVQNVIYLMVHLGGQDMLFIPSVDMNNWSVERVFVKSLVLVLIHPHLFTRFHTGKINFFFSCFFFVFSFLISIVLLFQFTLCGSQRNIWKCIVTCVWWSNIQN